METGFWNEGFLKPTDIGGREPGQFATESDAANREVAAVRLRNIARATRLILRAINYRPPLFSGPRYRVASRRGGAMGASPPPIYPISACAPVACPGCGATGPLFRTTSDAIRPVARRPRRGDYGPWGTPGLDARAAAFLWLSEAGRISDWRGRPPLWLQPGYWDARPLR